VRDLVERQPQPELLGREPEALLERQHVRAHVVDDVLVLGALVLDDQQVVLAEHAPGHPPQQQADLDAGGAARHGAAHPGQGAAAVESAVRRS
jgi:hypothetical protein